MDHIQEANRNLIESARRDDEPGVEEALSAGAELEAKDRDGWTAAMFGAGHRHRAGRGLLIGAGADAGAKDDKEWTAALWASYNVRGDCLDMLIAAGADIEAKSQEGETAAMIASARGHPGLAALIEGVLRSRKEAAELEVSSASRAVGAGRRGPRV